MGWDDVYTPPMFAKRTSLLMILVGLTAVGCKTDDSPDARQLPPPSFDARTGDAPPSSSADARVTDAAMGGMADARPAVDASSGAVDAPLAMPDAMQATPDAMEPTGAATLIINEIAPSGDTMDLVELVAVTGGTVNNITLYQDITNDVELLARLPDVTVAAGDIIVVHLTPDTSIVADEVATQEDCTDASCYDTAWDFIGETDAEDQQVGYSHRVLYLLTPAESYMDAVAFMRHNVNRRDDFVADLLYITGEGPDENPGVDVWQSKCADICDFDHIDNMYAATVDWTGAGVAPSGDTAQRKTGAPNTRTVDDWQTLAQPQTLGLPN
jgi:hypothetical protein